MSTYSAATTPEALSANPATSGTPLATAIVLIAATMLTGMATGLIALYAHTIMPGLKKTDDHTFVAAFQALDRAVYNPWFMATFFGPLLLLGVAVVQHLGVGHRAALPWTSAAFVLYLVGVIVTMAVNVPLNDALKAAGDPNQINVAEARAAFNESKWMAWNHVRLFTSTSALLIIAGVTVFMKRK
jgi:uncharacterized membrane protein